MFSTNQFIKIYVTFLLAFKAVQFYYMTAFAVKILMHYCYPVQKCMFFWIARCCTVNIILSIVVGKEAIKLGTCLIWASTWFV